LAKLADLSVKEDLGIEEKAKRILTVLTKTHLNQSFEL
jgi:hypothetical protein